jgi:hypothetical protein
MVDSDGAATTRWAVSRGPMCGWLFRVVEEGNDGWVEGGVKKLWEEQPACV